LQQFVEGEHFAVCGLADAKHTLQKSVVIKTIQSCPQGKIWMASTLDKTIAAPFIAVLENIVKASKWTGPIEIDCIRDRYTENIVCIDINMRFPSWAFYTSNGLMSHYLAALLQLKTPITHSAHAHHLYVRFPRNYYSNTRVLGELLAGKELQYHE
jgi:hypothetical protein